MVAKEFKDHKELLVFKELKAYKEQLEIRELRVCKECKELLETKEIKVELFTSLIQPQHQEPEQMEA